ncbi:hypothetical protein [Burkholderia gladioli]|uniref:hypothetical protein n=1 Tax=Burkholderia gladioli TaxID=28095 RepID=UPI00163F5321|nr:hypothetical protein [Burkholderia gladioli]
MTMTPSQQQAELYAMRSLFFSIATVLGPETLLPHFDRFSEQTGAHLLGQTITEQSLTDFELAAQELRRQLIALIPPK